MKKFTCFIVLCFLIFITGCNSVFTTHPMGESPLKINERDWDGTWINKGGSVVVKVTNPEKGHLIAALIKSSKDDLMLEKYDIEIRGSNDFVLINIKNNEEKEKPLYVWGKIKKNGEEIVIWGPDTEKFRDLINAGKLPGKIKNKDVYLNPLKDEHRKFILSEKNELLFDLNNPAVFFRLAK